MEIERMLYRRYKTSYADCETVVGYILTAKGGETT